MDGRFFDGRRVSATFYPVEAFLNGDFTLQGAEVQQTAITSSLSHMASRSSPRSGPPRRGSAAAARGEDIHGRLGRGQGDRAVSQLL